MDHSEIRIFIQDKPGKHVDGWAQAFGTSAAASQGSSAGTASILMWDTVIQSSSLTDVPQCSQLLCLTYILFHVHDTYDKV